MSQNMAEASPAFFIGPKKDRRRYKYTASGLERQGFPVFKAEGKDTVWIFKADDGYHFQCNYGEQFEASRPRFRTEDSPWVPGAHCWDQFIERTGEWKHFGHFETTLSDQDANNMSGLAAENPKRRRLEPQMSQNMAEASPAFFIGPKKDRRRYKYTASGLERQGFPVFKAEGKDTVWIFKADDGYHFQCNYGEQFETSRPRFRTEDSPWVPGAHCWDQFIERTGEWKHFGHFETTLSDQDANNMSGLAAENPKRRRLEPQMSQNMAESGSVPSFRPQWSDDNTGQNCCTRELLVDNLLYSQYSIKLRFSDGRPVGELIKSLNAWELDPMKEEFLCLDAFEIDGHIHCADNRRLFCLKRHQEHLRPQRWGVWVKVKVGVVVTDELMKRVLRRGLKNNGREIHECGRLNIPCGC